MILSGEHFDQLHAALLGAFNRAELTQFVRTDLGVDLDHVAGSGTLNEVVAALISWAERNERIGDLVTKAAQAVPQNAALKQAAAVYPAWLAQAQAGPMPQGGRAPAPHRARGHMTGARVLLAAGAIGTVLALAVYFGSRLLPAPAPAGEQAPAGAPGTPTAAGNLAEGLTASPAAAATAAPDATATPATPAEPTQPAEPTPTPLPFATARPGEYLVVVGEFYPPLAEFPEFDPLDTLVALLQDAFAGHDAKAWRVEEHVQPILDAAQARRIGTAAQARAVLWGRVSAGRLRVNITSPNPQAEIIATRLGAGLALPPEAYFTEYAPDRLQRYIAPFVLSQYFMYAAEYDKAHELLGQAVAAASADPPDGIEHAYLAAGNAAYMLKDYAGAVTQYSAALAANPSMHDALYNRALANKGLQDYAASDQDIATLLAKAPGYSYAHVAQGLSLMRQAFLEKDADVQRTLRLAAKAAYEEALATLPPAEAAYAFDIFSNLAVANARLGDVEQAKAGFLRAVGEKFDCAPVFTSDLARFVPERVGNMCAQAAYNFGGLFAAVDAGNKTTARQLAELVIAHATVPDLRSLGLARLAMVYRYEGNVTAACALAKEALAGAATMQKDLRAHVGEMCAAPTPPPGLQ